MGSYAYLTAGIITARQAELMKNAFWPMLRQGLLYTIPLTLVSFAIGVIIAVLCALFIINKIPVLKQIAGIYIWVFRGTPLLVQLFIMYWGICNPLGINKWVACISALSLNEVPTPQRRSARQSFPSIKVSGRQAIPSE